MNMKQSVIIFALLLAGLMPAKAQNNETMNRIETCKENYRTLFGGEALTGQGTDPEMMDILQKFIFGEVFTTGNLSLKQREMITCVTLATMQTLPQLKAHAGAVLNVGVTPVELREAMYLTAPFIGFPAAIKALRIIKQETAKPTVSATDNLVRLSKITVDVNRLDEYNAYLKEEIEASMRLEPGVLTLYATAEKNAPHKITILEIYADRAAYENHLKSPHFQKYKQGTLEMVKDLELVDTTPLIPGLKIK